MEEEHEPFNDVESLREKLVELSEKDLIQQTKKFLMDKRRCTERVMRKTMSEYQERRRKMAKSKMASALVCVAPRLMEKSCVICFKEVFYYHYLKISFSTKITANEDTMFCIMEPGADLGFFKP